MPILPQDDTPRKRGEYYLTDTAKFTASVKQFLDGEKLNGRCKSKVIVLTDVMSGDARLLALYAARVQAPLIYIRELSKLESPDFLEAYMLDVGARIYKMALNNSQEAYNTFLLKGVAFRKGAMLTEEIADILKRIVKDNPNNNQVTRDDFKQDVATRFPFDDAAARRKLIDVVVESRPIVVVWTKSVVSGGYWKGHPEHLLGKTGAAQVAGVAREAGFKVAVAGDMVAIDALRADHDLRYLHGGLLDGLTMQQQYGAFNYINQRVPLISVGMRSGNLEPLPILGIRTIYLEELGNNQAGRMQKLEEALPNQYTRHMFALPPTLKGRMRELATYFYSWPFQQSFSNAPPSLRAHAPLAEAELQRLMVQLVRALDPSTPLNYTYQELKGDKDRKQLLVVAFDEAKTSGDRFSELKKSLVSDSTRGFMREDLELLRTTLAAEKGPADDKLKSHECRTLQTEAAMDYIFAGWNT